MKTEQYGIVADTQTVVLFIRSALGLRAKQYDPHTRRQLGNFPQAFSHIGLINTARNLSSTGGPAQQRKRSAHSAPLSALLLAALTLSGCTGAQSALDPASRDADRLADLFWWMTAGTVVIWLAMIALTLYALRGGGMKDDPRHARLWIVGGGAVVPTVVLAALLIYGLAMLPALVARAPEGSLRIVVTGEQWWWRVRYEPPDGEPVMLANEIRLPVGEPVQFILESPDVIHSFWIPPLGGKVDMIPGRRTHLALTPSRTGRFRGVCAEYCGSSHALMAFDVVVLEKADYDAWLARQRQPADSPAEPLAEQGRALFLSTGCSACHTVRGIGADGLVGPDLTHFASRLSVGAGTLPNGPEPLARWLARTDAVKPGVLMPHFGMLPPDDLRALTAYLTSLR